MYLVTTLHKIRAKIHSNPDYNGDQANNDIILSRVFWAVRKKDEKRLHVAEMRMLRWIRDKTRKDHVRNQVILVR